MHYYNWTDPSVVVLFTSLHNKIHSLGDGEWSPHILVWGGRGRVCIYDTGRGGECVGTRRGGCGYRYSEGRGGCGYSEGVGTVRGGEGVGTGTVRGGEGVLCPSPCVLLGDMTMVSLLVRTWCNYGVEGNLSHSNPCWRKRRGVGLKGSHGNHIGHKRIKHFLMVPHTHTHLVYRCG